MNLWSFLFLNMYQKRFYRDWIDSDLTPFEVKEDESDIFVLAEKNLAEVAKKIIRECRRDIKEYIRKRPEFETSFEPLRFDTNAPSIIASMLKASERVGVGPMAAVAGAISEYVGRGLLEFTKEVIVENGGDIFIKTKRERKSSIYAGTSPLSGKLSIKIKPKLTPLAMCTSSGTVGHSLSFGKADAATILAQDGALSDACATAVCNKVKCESDIETALNFAKSIEGVLGAVVIYKDKVGSIGEIELE